MAIERFFYARPVVCFETGLVFGLPSIVCRHLTIPFAPRPNQQRPAMNHFNEAGEARMVDVSQKASTERVAVAEGWVSMSSAARDAVKSQSVVKGDVIAIARLAGIMATKQTQHLIPLCHSIAIESVSIDFHWQGDRLRITASVATTGKTGVEMEAMTAISIAALTVYDMTKSVDRWISIGPIELVRKSGGKSGAVVREPPQTPMR